MSISSLSRADAVAAYIEDRIRVSRLEPGDRICTKKDLQDELGVAAATVSEAVKLLNDRGRVVAKTGPRGGLFVAESDPGIPLGRFLLAVGTDASALSGAMELRDYLEFLIVEHATKYRSADDLDELRDILDELVRHRLDIELHVDLVWRLHLRIGAITPNATLRATYAGLMAFIAEHVDSPRSSEVKEAPFFDQRIALHRGIVEAIESGDTVRAREAVGLHNEQA